MGHAPGLISCLQMPRVKAAWRSCALRVLAVVGLTFLSAGLRAEVGERTGCCTFSVRAMHPAEMPGDTSREWMQFFWPGMASGALGMAAPPMYASALVVGGLILAPAALVMSGRERQTWQRVTGALGSVAFEQELLQALTRRARGMVPGDAGSATSVELIVNAYGLAGARPERLCFIASAVLVVRVAGDERLRDSLSIAESDASADAPPAQCAGLDRFAAQDGQLVRDTAKEYAEVLAVMALDRLQAAMQ